MVRDHDAVHAVLDTELGVFGGDYPFQEHLHGGDVAQPLDDVPGEAGIVEAGEPAAPGDVLHLDPVEHALSRDVTRKAGNVADLALPLVEAGGERGADPVASGGKIHRQRDRRATGRLGAGDELFRHLEIGGRIKLVPDRFAPRLVHFLHGGGRHRGEQLEVLHRPRGAGHGDLALGVKRLLAPAGGDADGGRPAPVEDLHRHVGVRDVHQPTRPNPDPVERAAVLGKGAFAVHAGRHVAVVGGRQVALRQHPEVEDVRRLFR